jgi:hypothetical protein
VSICSDSQEALKALWDVKATSPLFQQCQKVLNDISTQHAMGFFGVPGHAGVRDNAIADELARGGSVLEFFGPETALGVSTRSIQRRLSRWLINQHGAT